MNTKTRQLNIFRTVSLFPIPSTTLGFKSFALFLAAATTVVVAIPTGTNAGMMKREAAPAPMPAAVPVARAAEAMALPVIARGGPTTVPDCFSKCTDTLTPIFVQIDAAVTAKADVTVFVNLFVQVLAAINVLVADITALVGVGVSVLGGLSLSACASLYANLVLSIVVKLQACVTVLVALKVDISAFVSVFVEIVTAIQACLAVVVKACVGINVFIDLNVNLIAAVNILLSLCASLNVVASVVAIVKGLILV